MITARSQIRLPLPEEAGYCVVVDDFLSAGECRALIAQAESRGFGSASPDYPPSYRNNDRLVIDDATLAGWLYERLQSVAAGNSFPRCDHAGDWRPDSVNERLRFCRYTAWQRFEIHQDGVHHRSRNQRSLLTFMIYLNDGAEFGGGDTLFFAHGPRANPDENSVVARVRPRAGSLILFDHRIWHAGETVTAGTKYVMRSDVLFARPDVAIDAGSKEPAPAHRGYVWTLARFENRRFASGGRDCRIRLWDDSGTCTDELVGHTQSVLGLARIDEQRLASVSRDRTLRIWDLQDGQSLCTLKAHDAAILTVAVVGEGMLATGGADHQIKLWNVNGAGVATIRAHSGWIWKIVRLTHSLMASASEDGSVGIWSTESFARIACLEAPRALRTIAASPEAGTLVTGDVGGYLRIWKNVPEQPRIDQEIRAHEGAIRCVQFIDAETIVSGGEDGCLKLWRIQPLQLCYQARHDNFVTDCLAFDAETGVSCSYDGTISFHAWRTV